MSPILLISVVLATAVIVVALCLCLFANVLPDLKGIIPVVSRFARRVAIRIFCLSGKGILRVIVCLFLPVPVVWGPGRRMPLRRTREFVDKVPLAVPIVEARYPALGDWWWFLGSFPLFVFFFVVVNNVFIGMAVASLGPRRVGMRRVRRVRRIRRRICVVVGL